MFFYETKTIFTGIYAPHTTIFLHETEKKLEEWTLFTDRMGGTNFSLFFFTFFFHVGPVFLTFLQIVDVPKNRCDDAYAYVPDLGAYGVVVYSFKDGKSWRVKNNYFYFDPVSGDFNVGGVNFQWTDGIYANFFRKFVEFSDTEKKFQRFIFRRKKINQ